MFIAQVLVGPSKQLKRVFQIEHNIVKNPNWLEANQLAIYNVAENLKAGVLVQHDDHSATLPSWYRASTVLLLYGKTDMRKMKTAMHDNDFAQKSKWEFKCINFTLEAAERKLRRIEISVFQVVWVVCQIIDRMTRWLNWKWRSGSQYERAFWEKTCSGSNYWARKTCWLDNSWSYYCDILRYYQVVSSTHF